MPSPPAHGAVVVDALRTPYGRRGGALSGWHPVDLAAELLSQLVGRNGLDGTLVDDVVLGCTSQVGAQACNVARRAVLAAGWPESVPGATVDRQAASSAQAVHWAAQAVMSGAQDLVVAGGVEVMTAVPLGANLAVPAVGKPYGRRLQERYRAGGGLLPPGLAAEEVVRRWSLRRDELDAWAFASQTRARRAQVHPPGHLVGVAAGAAPSGDVAAGLLVRDEALAPPNSLTDLAALAPIYVEGGSITAANMAAEGDGAAALLIASPQRARDLGLVARARVVSFAVGGGAPDVWPVATVAATSEALRRAGLAPGDVDRFEVHESSAAAVLAWLAGTDVPAGRVNPEGGALATTAPLGACGAGLFAAAVAGLVSGDEQFALVCIAGEGGVATACVLERA
ncbi:MAG: thiolase family protein [Acidimicrobiales bacterium]